MTANGQPMGAHLVGSVPLANSEEVFRTSSEILGDHLRRIPDGETGERTNWIGFQIRVYTSNPSFELVNVDRDSYTQIVPIKLRDGVNSSEIKFTNLIYADMAKESYATFARLKEEGVVPAHARFQVCLPTPIAGVYPFVGPMALSAVEPAYAARMLEEVDEIAAAIPHDQLAIQWDVAVEIAMLEGAWPTTLADPRTEIMDRLVQLGSYVPADIEMGYHLCYGDAGHQHFKQPADTTLLMEISNELTERVGRTINWIHMPVPRDRTDSAYLEPLRNLKLAPETELYLGLVHITDGVEGTQKRIETAQQVVPSFGVGTECGMGRRPAAQVSELLQVHAETSAPVGQPA